MSTQGLAFVRAEEAINKLEEHEADPSVAQYAEAVVNAVLPEISDPSQLRGVPEGSILIVPVQAGARAARWEDGLLHGDIKADRMPMDPKWVIDRYGPITVVWMP